MVSGLPSNNFHAPNCWQRIKSALMIHFNRIRFQQPRLLGNALKWGLSYPVTELKSVITPGVQIQSNPTWYAIWLETSSGIFYIWIYNEGTDSVGRSVTLATTGYTMFPRRMGRTRTADCSDVLRPMSRPQYLCAQKIRDSNCQIYY